MVYFIFAHVRAYAIRPYTCSVIVMAEYGESLPPFYGDTYKKNCLLRLNDALAEKKLISLNNDKKLIALRTEPDGLRFVVHRVDDGYRL